MPNKRSQAWITVALIAVVVAIFAISFMLAPRPTEEDAEAFAGTDSVVTQVIEDEGYEPWFSPIFEPGSGEIESGLFALQAALGAGLLGFALGNLRGRHVGRQQVGAAPEPQDNPAGTTS